MKCAIVEMLQQDIADHHEDEPELAVIEALAPLAAMPLVALFATAEPAMMRATWSPGWQGLTTEQALAFLDGAQELLARKRAELEAST